MTVRGIFFDSKLNNEPTMYLGVVNDMLKFAILFNRYDDIRNMVLRGHFYPKAALRMKVWDRAWALEDVYWRITFESHKSLDLLKRIIIASSGSPNKRSVFEPCDRPGGGHSGTEWGRVTHFADDGVFF